MSYDIYGNPLRRGHCEVHPHVHEEYPCSICIQENNNINAIMELEYVLELSQQRIAELERCNNELTATVERLRDAIDVALDQHKRDGAMSASVAYDLEMLLCS